MANIVIQSENDSAFSAVLKAFAKATDSDIIPMSKWVVEPEDSNKSVKISAKIHVDKSKRLQVRDDAAGYLNYFMDKDPSLGLEVVLGTPSNPDKEKLDFVVRLNPSGKKEIIRIEIKPTNVGGSGGGSAATTVQEVALATFLAMRYEKGSALECHPTRGKNCIDENDYIKGLANVDHNNSVKVEEIMALDSSWIESCIKGANKIADVIKGSNWTFVRGDTILDDGAIKKAFLRVKRKKGSQAPVNEDKWNPSDIWMVQKGKQAELKKHLDVEGTIDCLNNFISLAFSKEQYSNNAGKNVPPRSLIGISLKKLGTSVHFMIMNEPGKSQMQKAQGTRFIKNKCISELTSFSAMDVYFMMNPSASKQKDSFQARNFGGPTKGDWKLELKGQYAAQGKIQGQVMRDLLIAVHEANSLGSPPPDEPKFADCKPNASKTVKKKITEEIYKLLKKYTAKDFDTSTKGKAAMESQIDNQEPSWRYSKLAGLRLLDWLCSLSQTNANRAMKEMYLYASSQTEKSSTYYKLY